MFGDSSMTVVRYNSCQVNVRLTGLLVAKADRTFGSIRRVSGFYDEQNIVATSIVAVACEPAVIIPLAFCMKNSGLKFNDLSLKREQTSPSVCLFLRCADGAYPSHESTWHAFQF